MKRQLPSKKTSERVFTNRFLEMLTRTSPTLTFSYYGGVVILLLFLHNTNTTYSLALSVVFFVLALLSWTLFEYILHRYLFHLTGQNTFVQRFHHLIHGVHHRNPHDEARLFMPPVPGTIILFIFYTLFYLLFGDKAFVLTAGFLCGYGIYASIHYIVHIYKPFGPFKYLWKHHAKHHFNDDESAFGVSTPIWDYIFRTMPPK